jgi:hypothetical protein
VSLAAFGPALFAAGLAGLAGILILLQRLRVRHRVVRVPTTLFWKEAVEESRARVFVRRFRHPWAYALALAAAGLLWLAAAAPQAAGDPAVEHLLVLDASAAMQRVGRFAAAAQAVRARAAELPRGSTRVVLAAGRPLALLEPGEDPALLARRLAAAAPEACPSTLADALRAAAVALPEGKRLAAEIFGDGALDPAWSAALPEGTTVQRASPPPAEPVEGGGIVALGVSESAAGRWDRVDLYARTVGATGPPAFDAPAGVAPVERTPIPGGEDWVLRGLPARGATATARLAADSLPADDSAERALPDRPPLRVALAPELPDALRAALAADSGVEIVGEGAQVAVRRAGDGFAPALPALELVGAGAGTPAFLVRGPARGGAGAAVVEVFDRLGLREVDALTLAESAGRAIELRFEESAAPRCIALWADLLGPEFDFVQSRAFPLFLAAAVRWLAATPDLRAELAAGGWLPAEDAPLRAADGRTLDGAGAPLRLPRAGAWTDAHGREIRAALLDPALYAPESAASFREGARPAARAFDPRPWIALLALALLAAEWILFRRGRIP